MDLTRSVISENAITQAIKKWNAGM